MSKLTVLRGQFAELQMQKKQREEALTETNKAIMAIQPKMVEVMHAEGLQNFQVPDVGTFYIKNNMTVKQIDKVLLFAELKKRKLGSLIKETIHAGSLKKLVKEMLAENKPLLHGIEIKTFESVVLMGGKKDEEE